MSTAEAHLINLPAELSETQFSEMISISIICRLCANQSDKLIGIYSDDGMNNDLAGKMNLYLPIKVSDSDTLPLQCCWQCASTVLAWHDLVVTSVEADRRLRSYQFVTEKQLEEITSSYGATENILAATAEENLKLTKEKDTPATNQGRTQLTRCAPSASDNITKSNQTTTLERSVNTEDSACEEPVVTEASEPEETEETIKTPKHLIGVTKPSENNVNLYFKSCADFGSLECNICEKTFDLKVNLKTHLRTIHSVKIPKMRRKKCDLIKNFQCSRCDKSYTKKHDLDRHLKSKHGQTNASNTRSKNKAILDSCLLNNSASEDGAQYRCDLCSKSFRRAFSLLRHRTIHANLKAYCCSFCGKSFRLNMSLTRHVSEVHNGIRKFQCVVCKKVFKNKWSRDEHANVHTDSRPYICDVCGKSFRQSASLYVHKRYHSSHYPYECNICHEQFHRKHNLEKHFTVHTGQKSHCCDECSATFATKQGLNRHKKCHESLTCDKCGSRFNQARYLKLHRNSCRQSLEGLKAFAQDTGLL